MADSHNRFRKAAALATVALLLGAVAWSRRYEQRAARSAPGATPEACLSEMTVAAQRGNVAAYLACFDGKLRDDLSQQADAAATEFAQQLQDSMADLRGVATYEERPASTDEAEMILERIYPRHNERFRAALVRGGNRWRVTELSRIGAQRPPVEYGTPVFTLPPAATGAKSMQPPAK